MLTPDDINQIVGEEVKLTTSPDFKNLQDVDELFYPNSNNALVLYQTHDGPNIKIGHWCCLKRMGDHMVFYDSYGSMPDATLKTMPEWYRKRTGQMKRDLSKLLCDSDYEFLHYNPHPHQKHEKGINTCGRHCAMYMKMDLLPEDYNNLVGPAAGNLGISTDELVTDITGGRRNLF